MKEVIFINSHPIQYFAPLYKYMNEQGIPTKAWYCSDKSVKGKMDVQFGVNVKWDIPILEGYGYKFFKNYSPLNPDSEGFFSLMNLGVLKALAKAPRSTIVVHGWHYVTHMLVILFAGLFGHTVCFRSEVPQNQELLKTGFKTRIRQLFLKCIIFPRVRYFLYIGSQNKKYYEAFGIKEKRLVFCPYAVDNARFQNEKKVLQPQVQNLRSNLGIAPADKVILYSGKYIDKKRPMDLLQAYASLDTNNCWLIMLGEGTLRKEMETYIADKKLSKVILTGFINQSKVSEFYAISNLFVMCSATGETWGLSVNEALNFDLPIIVSDTTGSSYDLVVTGDNGYVSKTGDIADLAQKLKYVICDNKLTKLTNAAAVLDVYSFKTIANNIAGINTEK